jgi:hypothetical protein
VTEASETVALLSELVAWTRFANRQALLEVWKDVLRDPKHLRAYELSDGSRSQKEVGEQSGLSQPTISTLWIRWRRLGLVVEVGGRICHIARPSDLGVALAGTKDVKET